MKKFVPPILKSDLVCITSNDVDIELLSTVCCYVNDSNTYFPIFKMPMIKKSLIDTDNIDDDSYFASVVAKKASTEMLNAIARIRCRKILLVGLSEEQKKYLKLEKYWKVTFIEINSIEDVVENLKFLNKKFNGVLYCLRNEIPRGLLCAKNENKLIIIDETAPSISNFINNKGYGLIVAESKNDILDIIMVNYAFSVNADVSFINGLNPSEVNDLRDKFVKWKRDESYGAYLIILSVIDKIIKDIKMDNYDYITFFTDGVPYGAYFNSKIPCSHVLRSIAIDLFVFNNIFCEQYEHYFGSAVIFSPNPHDLAEYTKIESETVFSTLKKSNVFVKKVLDKNATVEAFDLYVGYYPYDVLHICSHGGETDGYYVVQKFTDREGKRHTVEYEEVVGFSRDEGEYVNVVSKKIFKYFDGFAWKSEELENQDYAQYVYTDMFKAICGEGKKSELTRTKIDYLIESSCHVRCYDDIHQGQFHALASQNYPFIFNNTCNSWGEFENQLIAGGCRAYIGTLWNIGNETATSSSNIFYGNAFDLDIISAANIMVNAIDNDKYKDIYLFCGLHFTSLKKPRNLSNERIIKEMAISLNRWLEKGSAQKSQEVLRKTIKIIQFLCRELTPHYYLPGITELLVKAAKFCYYLKLKLI